MVKTTLKVLRVSRYNTRKNIEHRIGVVKMIRDMFMRFMVLLEDVECRVMSSTSWRPRIAEAVFIRGRGLLFKRIVFGKTNVSLTVPVPVSPIT